MTRALPHRVAAEVMGRSPPATELLDLAHHVAAKLFPTTPLAEIPTGLSGALLTHATVRAALAPRTSLPLTSITAAPIEGVRRLLVRSR